MRSFNKYGKKQEMRGQDTIQIVEEKGKQLIFIPYQNMNNQFQFPDGQQKYQENMTRNRLKGAKYKLSDVRIKQKIKDRSSHHKLSLRASGNLFHQNTFEILTDLNKKDSNWTNEDREQYEIPKTRASTCDASTHIRRNTFSQKNERKKNKKISFAITQNHIQPKYQTIRSYFNSSNLDSRMNDYMNLMIRNQYKNEGESEKLMNKIHTEGMVPHAKKLNSFKRKMKIYNKVKSLSNEKIKNQNPLQVKNLNKTIEAVLNKRERGDSPLVYQLEYKTIFSKLSQKSHSKQKYFL